MRATQPDHGLTGFVASMFEGEGLDRMGHNQREADANLGLGWVYYALGRLLHPERAVVIGSYRGFVPMVIARALHDNVEDGQVTFVDPSLVDDFWTDPAGVDAYFSGYGLANLHHHRATTQEFVTSDAYRALGPVGLVFIDGYHTAEQARIDYEAFAPLLAPRGIVLFHDSMSTQRSPIYGPDKTYQVSVVDYLDELRQDPALQLFDLPFGTGLTLLRRVADGDAGPLLEGLQGRP